MCKLLSEQIFKPGSFPEYTYISRKSSEMDVDYEVRLKQALKISGCLTSIIGPSKMGKTVLCEKVIDLKNLVEVSGVDFKEDSDFWRVIAAKAELPLEGEFSESKVFKGTTSEDSHNKKEKFVLTKDKVIDYFKENGKVLVLDDFHYAPSEVQMHIAQQLKDAIRREFKAIVVSLPHRADDAIRKNADLSGRLSLINIEPWNIEELQKIAIKGFEKLNVKISPDIARNIAVESLTSPQLMQYICLSICTLLDIDNGGTSEISEEILERAYKFTTVNFEYADIVKVLKEGPNSRGNKRKIYKIKLASEEKDVDIYDLIVEAMAVDPPLMGMTIDEIKSRIDALIISEGKKPDKQQIRDSINKLQTIITEKENIYRVFEWKDGKVYILDPLFLFYLRWGKH